LLRTAGFSPKEIVDKFKKLGEPVTYDVVRVAYNRFVRLNKNLAESWEREKRELERLKDYL
jgi:hypothetical protein